MASALPAGDLGVRMRNDRHEPNRAEKQRPERIPADPEHRELLTRCRCGCGIDPLLQNGRRLEHHHARDWHFGAGGRVRGDALIFLGIFRHGSFSLIPDRRTNAYRSIGIRAGFTHVFINVT